ncbi:uncharacterized protein LOC135653873 isoform X1 [Musa acuminata AAA Group]|uniref:uncharacterized protein LOC135653873 isoform X1 n=1 Tax=Musa acuminata AAA Group TaxID=214697 RepID=UPI0031D67B6E
MGSLGAMPVAEVKKVPAAGTQEEEEAVGGEVAAVLDFDMLCATVALQTQGMSVGRSRRIEAVAEEGDEDEGMDFGGVQRMWEGDVTDCFDDRRIAIEAACCPCYRFGMNVRRANLGSCFLQATAHSIFIVAALFSFIAFGITNRHCFLYMAIASTISSGLYLGHFRTRLKKRFNIRGSHSLLDCINHLICPCCTLCQVESRTLEMNNVQNGVWHGRGDTICLATGGEGSKAFTALHKPPLFATRIPDLCSMERASNGSEHSWNADTSHSKSLVLSDQLGQHN